MFHRLLSCLVGLILACCSACGTPFGADDARVQIVFRVDVDESAADGDAVLESVRHTIEQRLDRSELVRWFLVRTIDNDRIEVLTPEISARQIEQIQQLATRPGTLEFALLANEIDHAEQIATVLSDTADEDPDGAVAWVPVGFDRHGQVREVGTHEMVVSRALEEGNDGRREFLVIRGPARQTITGDLLDRASVGVAPDGSLAIDFQFNPQGGYLLQRLTARNAPKPGAGYRSRLAIILDGEIYSAPAINEMVGGRGQITGNFDPDDARELAAVLNSGALAAPVEQSALVTPQQHPPQD